MCETDHLKLENKYIICFFLFWRCCFYCRCSKEEGIYLWQYENL